MLHHAAGSLYNVAHGEAPGDFTKLTTSSANAGQYNTTSSKTDGFNVITWGLDSRATSYDSGSCSFKECVAPTLTVSMAAHKTAARAGVKYRLEVFHKVLVLNSISSSDGRVSQSISI